jgi:hypothetical protein
MRKCHAPTPFVGWYKAPVSDTPREALRRPLSHVHGAEERFGDPVAAEQLAAAFAVPEDEQEAPIRGVHGLHPYPARLHPSWASRLLALTPPDANVFDPFCGSGTVLVEAQRSGRPARGSDVNDVALRIARQRTAIRDDGFLGAFADAAQRVHDNAADRRDTPFAILAKGEKSLPPHVLGPMIALRDEIEQVPDPELREALLIAGLSPLLGKFAGRPGRKAPEVGRSAARQWFLRRCQQAMDAWQDHAPQVPPGTPRPIVERADARESRVPDHSVRVVISSPPYPGVYDYVAEQELRARWLGGVDWIHQARREEIGRRDGNKESWARSMEAVLIDLRRVTVSGADLFLVVGDGAVRGEALRVDKILRTLIHTRKLPFERAAMISQVRPHFHGPSRAAFEERERREHLLWLRRR